MPESLTIYKRSDVVNFMNTGTSLEPVYTRMQGFTSAQKQLNAKKYTRQYVDEDFERESTVGFSPNIAYAFDRIVGNAVHEKIVKVHEDELTNQAVEILTVNTKTNEAKLRTYDINPDTDGDGTDAYTFSGNFHANGAQINGTATISADGLTATFTQESV